MGKDSGENRPMKKKEIRRIFQKAFSELKGHSG
jgi:hypothetical protein